MMNYKMNKSLILVLILTTFCFFSKAQTVAWTDTFTTGVPISASNENNWNSFRASLNPGAYFTVKISGTFNPTGIICNDPAFVNALATALKNNTSYITPSPCNGNIWSVCWRYFGEVWLNAPSLCDYSNCLPGYIIRPGIGVGSTNWGGVNTNTCNDPPSQRMTLAFIGYDISCNISPTTFCAGASISVPYTISGTFNSGNVFTAQLSNASGSFASPVNIGSVSSTTSGTINATIPINTPFGSGYRIRVISSNPGVIGSNNGQNLTVNCAPYRATFTAMNTGSATWCAGEARTVSVTVTNSGTATWTNSGPDVNIGATWSNDLSYPWRVNANNLAPGQSQTYNITVTAPASPGSYTLQFDVVKEGDCWFGSNTGSCGPGNAAYVSAAQTVSGSIATASLTGGSICPPATGANVTLATSQTGVTYQLYKTIFKDDFETFTGWSTYGTGVVAQSTLVAQSGIRSLIKTTNGDPNGGIKAIGQTVGNAFLFEGWLNRTVGTSQDRVALMDASGNGYGFRISGTQIAVERRNTGIGADISSLVTYTRTANQWYRFVFLGNGNGTYTLNIYNNSGVLEASVTSSTDNTYSSFTQVAVLGGFDYHVDNIRLSLPQSALGGTGNALVWSNNTAGEYQVYSGVTSACARILTNVAYVTGCDFITDWNLATAGSGATQISFGVGTTGTVNYTWQEISPGNASGSGSFSGSTATITGLPAGSTIRLSIAPANFNRIIINNGTDKNRLADVKQWGAIAWDEMQNAFYGCTNLNITATDLPNLSGVSDMGGMFRDCNLLNGPANIGSWNTASVTDMSSLFRNAWSFNRNISGWNTAAVTLMYDMFRTAESFNQPIGSWNTALVTDMSAMFRSALNFNQSLNSWNTASVTDMSEMFLDALDFNGNISNWNTSAVVSMGAMFAYSAFNQNIGGWNTAAVTGMSGMFEGASNFNQNIGNWNTGAVTNMSGMFQNAGAFNQNISNWNTASVTNMNVMFSAATSFNQPIGNWNTANVSQMAFMFELASSFNQNLGNWTLNSNVDMSGMLNNSGLDCANYSATLGGWANPTSPTGRSLGATGMQYDPYAATSRTYLTSFKGWSIIGDAAVSGTTWYLDADNDGYYTNTINICSNPGAGWTQTVTASGDCATNDATKWQLLSGYVDADGDGYTVGSLLNNICSGATLPSGYSATSLGTDCNDNNAAINPAATEVCGNGIDEDCSGSDLACAGPVQWTGNSNTEWNNAGNWNGGIPTAGADVVIASGATNYPSLEVNVTVNNIEIETGATLTIQSGQSLTVEGILTNNGTVTVASGGALVQEDGSTLAGSGTYIVERAITAGQRFIGSPIDNHSVSGFGISPSGTNGGQIIPVTNPLYRCNNDSIAATSPYGNIMELIENAAVIDNCAQSLWHVKSTGNLTNARGYAVNAAANTTLTFIGTVNNDDKTYGPLGRQTGSLDQWNGNSTTTRGWHLVSNPYPSPITFTNGSLGGSFDNQIQLFDGSSFIPFTLSGGPVTVAVGQGFQIRVATEGGSSTFSVNNNMRVAGNPTFYRQQSPFSQYVDITLSNSQYSDKSTLYFEADATPAFDSQYDANRLFGAPNIPLLYTKETNGEYLAYNALPLLEVGNTQTVHVGVYDGATAGEFTLSFDGVSTLNATVMLEDLKLNTMQQVNEGFVYNFTTEAGDSRDRFLLHFSADVATSIVTAENSTIKLFPNPTKGETNLILSENHGFSKAVIMDISGRTVQSYNLNVNKTSEALNTAELNNGIYFIQLTGNSNSQTFKLIKQ